MIAFFHHRAGHYAVLCAVAGLMFFANLGGASLWDVDEGRNSTCAGEMREAGNWIVPTFNGKLRIDKPALLYWLQIFAYNAFGVNEFAARLPSASAALLTVLVTYELARSMFTISAGLIAGVIVGTVPMMCGAARFANPDALLNFFTVLTLAIFWFGFESRRWWWFALLGVSSGMAVLAKGPVGLVLPGAINVLFLCWQREWRLMIDRRWLVTALGFTLTAMPWYILVGVETKGEFLSGFLWRHNVERGFSAMENHRGFPGYYVVILLVGMMPWSIFLAAAWWIGFWSAIRQPWVRCQGWWAQAADVDEAAPRLPAAYRLLACWAFVYLVFFSIAATKLPNYALPAVVPCAILMARVLQRWQDGKLAMPTWYLLVGSGFLFLVGVGIGAGLSIVGGVGELSVMRGRFFHGLEWWAPLGIAPIAAAMVGAWFVHKRQSGRYIAALAMTAVVLFAPMAALGSVLFNGYKVPRELVERGELLRRDQDIRIGCWQMEHLPSLNFYVQRNVEHLHEDKDIARFLAYRLPAYLFMPAKEWERLEPALRDSARVLGRQYDLYHRGDMVLITNAKSPAPLADVTR